MFITDDQDSDPLGDIYSSGVYASDIQAMIPVHRQLPVIPCYLAFGRRKIPLFHFMTMLEPVSLQTFDPQGFWRVEIWLLVEQIIDFWHAVHEFDSKHVAELEASCRDHRIKYSKGLTLVTAGRLWLSHFLQCISSTKKMAGRCLWKLPSLSCGGKAQVKGISLFAIIRGHGSRVEKVPGSGKLHIQDRCLAASLRRDHFAQLAQQFPVCPFSLRHKPRLHASVRPGLRQDL